MNIFTLAEIQLQREKKSVDDKNYINLLLDRAIIIRKYIDNSRRNKIIAVNRWNKQALTL
jgi:hypothetical protein